MQKNIDKHVITANINPSIEGENIMFTGSLVALVTPMKVDGSIDFDALERLVDWHIEAKTNGLVIAGTTGEAATLTLNEQYELISRVVTRVKRRIPVIAGTGTNSTQHTLELTRNAIKAGADAALIVTPYYNNPPQDGLIEHYQTIAKATQFPIILYNVPGRTACDMLPETVARLAKIPNIIGIKEATGKLDRVLDISKLCGKDFLIYSGTDAINLEIILSGGHGVISVTANIAPGKMHDFCKAAISGNKKRAEELHTELMPLHKKLFLQSNPIPVKWALHEMGKIAPGIRLPLIPLEEPYRAELKTALHDTGVLQEKTLT
jgi:4-hydroxy-tetrahydrodipicolinate synthase